MIEIKNVMKTIDGNTILNNINLSFKNGKIYGVYGRNGSGKSMLFRDICGLINIDSGSIKINKVELSDENINVNNIGVLIEKPKFIDILTGKENLELLASIRKKVSSEDIDNVLKLVNLYDEKDKKYSKYSLGMKQKLSIAQALMENPDILILDEPFNGLDKKSVSKLRDIIKDMKKEGKLIIIASHIREDIEELSDIKIEIDNGEIIK